MTGAGRSAHQTRFNWQLIVPMLGGVAMVVGAGLLVCAAVGALYGDGGALAFTVTGASSCAGAVAAVLAGRRLREMPFRPRDGFFAVTLAWVLASAIGAAAYLAAGVFTSPADAFFESMSGFTTTGATVIADVEQLPRAVLLWRSLSQWLGGVGIVVLVVAIAPVVGLASQRTFYAETSGVAAERLTPRIADTAKIIWAAYLVLTLLGLAAYLLAGMGGFDAVNHSFTTIASGGFSTRNASLGHFDSPAVEAVAVLFMIAGGINFAFYWRAVRGMSLRPQWAEVRVFLAILAVGTGVVSASLLISGDFSSPAETVRHSAFTVTSIVTTTGFVTADYDMWNDFARLVVFLLLFAGACAGSTSGGLKTIRLVLLARALRQEIHHNLHPKAVQVLRVSGRVFDEEVRRGVIGYVMLFVAVLIVGTLALAACGLDLMTASSGAAATLSVVGPGLGQVGGLESFADVPVGGLWVMSTLMLIGRLELFTVLVLFTRAFWRRNGF